MIGSRKSEQRLAVQEIAQGLQSSDRNPRLVFPVDPGTCHGIHHPFGNPTAGPIEDIDNHARHTAIAVTSNDSHLLSKTRMMGIANLLNSCIVSSV